MTSKYCWCVSFLIDRMSDYWLICENRFNIILFGGVPYDLSNLFCKKMTENFNFLNWYNISDRFGKGFKFLWISSIIADIISKANIISMEKTRVSINETSSNLAQPFDMKFQNFIFQNKTRQRTDF